MSSRRAGKIVRAGEIICPSGKSARASEKSLSSRESKNISLNPSGKSVAPLPPSRPSEGRLAIVTHAGRGAVDAGGSQDERHQRGRRSRVVLTPRRWRQGRGATRERRWQKSPVTGESTK